MWLFDNKVVVNLVCLVSELEVVDSDVEESSNFVQYLRFSCSAASIFVLVL